MVIPRNEYPRPQFVRKDWLCLNGQWQFEIDQGDSGIHRGLFDRPLKGIINVPFCPESKLSGVENNDFLNAVWYRRSVTIPEEWGERRVLLHFQAVDYDTTVWVNNQEVGRHRGGFSPFCCDLKGIVKSGERVVVTVRARDTREFPQPRGKQAEVYGPEGCLYLRTTGIWQTVWMEPVPDIALRRSRITPDLAHNIFRLEQPLTGNAQGLRLRAVVNDSAGEVSQVECSAEFDLTPRLDLQVPKDRRRLWSVDDPHLYDIVVSLLDQDGKVIDEITTYSGLRSVSIEGKAIKINGKAIFQRLVLDQGYYPGGIMTAPSDGDLRRDIELSMEAGFNGARLHQKVFEERFLYYADKLGYLVWGEFGDWGCRYGADDMKINYRTGMTGEHQKPGPDYITQWLEVLERDYSHPSIVGWCPLNETWQQIVDRITTLDDITRGMYLATKAMDSSRPVLDTSGYSHRVPEADVYDSHDYTQDPAVFKDRHKGLAQGEPFRNRHTDNKFLTDGGKTEWSIPYNGQPFFVSEFGGIWWNPDAKEGEDSWGYGERPKSIEEFYERFEKLCAVLLEDPNMFGYCYTQLTDVFQEQNGVFKFDRTGKFDLEILRKAQGKTAAIELT